MKIAADMHDYNYKDICIRNRGIKFERGISKLKQQLKNGRTEQK